MLEVFLLERQRDDLIPVPIGPITLQPIDLTLNRGELSLPPHLLQRSGAFNRRRLGGRARGDTPNRLGVSLTETLKKRGRQMFRRTLQGLRQFEDFAARQ